MRLVFLCGIMCTWLLAESVNAEWGENNVRCLEMTDSQQKCWIAVLERLEKGDTSKQGVSVEVYNDETDEIKELKDSAAFADVISRVLHPVLITIEDIYNNVSKDNDFSAIKRGYQYLLDLRNRYLLNRVETLGYQNSPALQKQYLRKFMSESSYQDFVELQKRLKNSVIKGLGSVTVGYMGLGYDPALAGAFVKFVAEFSVLVSGAAEQILYSKTVQRTKEEVEQRIRANTLEFTKYLNEKANDLRCCDQEARAEFYHMVVAIKELWMALKKLEVSEHIKNMHRNV